MSQNLSPSPSLPLSKSRRAKRGPGRPRKPKRDHSVTLTLTLPNAAFRRHLQRLAKAAGHKTPSALIIATFPVPTFNPPPPPSPRQSGQ